MPEENCDAAPQAEVRCYPGVLGWLMLEELCLWGGWKISGHSGYSFEQFFWTRVRKYHGGDPAEVPWHTSSHGNRVVVLKLMWARRRNYSVSIWGTRRAEDILRLTGDVFCFCSLLYSLKIVKDSFQAQWGYFWDPAVYKAHFKSNFLCFEGKSLQMRIMMLHYIPGAWLRMQIIQMVSQSRNQS